MADELDPILYPTNVNPLGEIGRVSNADIAMICDVLVKQAHEMIRLPSSYRPNHIDEHDFTRLTNYFAELKTLIESLQKGPSDSPKSHGQMFYDLQAFPLAKDENRIFGVVQNSVMKRILQGMANLWIEMANASGSINDSDGFDPADFQRFSDHAAKLPTLLELNKLGRDYPENPTGFRIPKGVK